MEAETGCDQLLSQRGEAGQVTFMPHRTAANDHFDGMPDARKCATVVKAGIDVNPFLGKL